MANPEKDDFNLDDLQFTDAGFTPLADLSEIAPAGEPLAAMPEPAPATAPAAVAEAAPAEPVEEEQTAKKATKEKKANVVQPVGDSEEGGKASFLQQVAEASPYTVLLGIAVVALLVAVLLMFVELRRYDFDIRATKGKQAITFNEAAVRPFADYCLCDYRNEPVS